MAVCDPNHTHKNNTCQSKIYKGNNNFVYGFYPEKIQNVTKYRLTLPFCPFEKPPEWLNLLLEFEPFYDILDRGKSSLSFISELNFLKECKKNGC